VACRDPELDLVTRLLILELVELRQNAWNLNENILAYYRQKLAQAKQFFKHCYLVMVEIFTVMVWIRICGSLPLS
jgi:hypothetical protein